MTRRLFLLEPDRPGAAWAPFAGVRPLAELHAGIWRVRERWEAAISGETTAILGDHAAGFAEASVPPVRAVEPVDGPAVIAASWFAPTGTQIPLGDRSARLIAGGRTVGWVVAAGDRWDGPTDRGDAIAVDGLALDGTTALLDALDQFLAQDCADLATTPGEPIPAGSIVLGDPALVISLGATIEPGVVFDVRHGAVVLERGAEIRSGTRLEGPVYVAPHTYVLGGFVRASVFGPQCRVRGEIASSVFLGYANKSHDGFVGHSVVGRWVNLGAGTTTSNLKNTYGPVRLDVAGERIETGRQNVGTLFGDHAKTAIGTLLPTGTVVGAGANVFGAGGVPKYVPPFAWGIGGEQMTLEGFLQVAERVMPRRGVELTPERRDALRHTFARLAAR